MKIQEEKNRPRRKDAKYGACSDHNKNRRHKALKIFGRIFVILFWGGVILICFLNREKLSVEGIVELVPQNSILSVVVMLSFYAVKSIAVFIYGSILYAASGILFSLPVAIAVNTVGTVIMTTIPFYIGKKAGSHLIEELIKKNSKLELLQDMQNKNEFFVSFFLRMVGLLPADLVAMYLGASGMRYKPYFFGTVIGLMPSIVCFSVMGMSIDDVGSPQFIISLIAEVGLMLLSLLIYFIWKQRNKKKREMMKDDEAKNQSFSDAE